MHLEFLLKCLYPKLHFLFTPTQRALSPSTLLMQLVERTSMILLHDLFPFPFFSQAIAQLVTFNFGFFELITVPRASSQSLLRKSILLQNPLPSFIE